MRNSKLFITFSVFIAINFTNISTLQHQLSEMLNEAFKLFKPRFAKVQNYDKHIMVRFMYEFTTYIILLTILQLFHHHHQLFKIIKTADFHTLRKYYLIRNPLTIRIYQCFKDGTRKYQRNSLFIFEQNKTFGQNANIDIKSSIHLSSPNFGCFMTQQ